VGRNNRAFSPWLTTGYGYSRAVLPRGYPFFAARYLRVCRHGCRHQVALTTTTVSFQTYRGDSNSVLQETPTSHALPIMGEYVPG
jgi:hypothetical protein